MEAQPGPPHPPQHVNFRCSEASSSIQYGIFTLRPHQRPCTSLNKFSSSGLPPGALSSRPRVSDQNPNLKVWPSSCSPFWAPQALQHHVRSPEINTSPQHCAPPRAPLGLRGNISAQQRTKAPLGPNRTSLHPPGGGFTVLYVLQSC